MHVKQILALCQNKGIGEDFPLTWTPFYPYVAIRLLVLFVFGTAINRQGLGAYKVTIGPVPTHINIYFSMGLGGGFVPRCWLDFILELKFCKTVCLCL